MPRQNPKGMFGKLGNKWWPKKIDWEKTKEILGADIQEEARRKTWEIIVRYAALEELRTNSSNLVATRQHLKKVKRTVEKLRALTNEDDIDLAQAHSSHLIANYLNHPVLPEIDHSKSRSPLETFRGILESMLESIQLGTEETLNPSLQRDFNKNWRNFVVDIRDTLWKSNLPTGVSKSLAEAGRASPFVGVVQYLQSLLPPGARRHEQSMSALAAAMQVAIRKGKASKAG